MRHTSPARPSPLHVVSRAPYRPTLPPKAPARAKRREFDTALLIVVLWLVGSLAFLLVATR